MHWRDYFVEKRYTDSELTVVGASIVGADLLQNPQRLELEIMYGDNRQARLRYTPSRTEQILQDVATPPLEDDDADPNYAENGENTHNIESLVGTSIGCLFTCNQRTAVGIRIHD